MQYFNIQVASQLSGVASATIRAWEKRYNAVVPERADNKHRLYSDKDIEKLAVLYQLTEIGQSIGKIAHLELEKLKEVYTSLLHKPYKETQIITPNHKRIIFDDVINNLLIALQTYRMEIIAHELDKVFSILSPKEICLDLLIPLYSTISKKLITTELKESHKRAIDELVIFHIGQLIATHYQKSTGNKDLIIISSPDNDERTIKLYLTALLLIQTGNPFLLLGSHVAIETLKDATDELKPKMKIICPSENFSNIAYLSEVQSHSHVPCIIIFEADNDTKLELEKRNCQIITRMSELYNILTKSYIVRS